MDCTDFRRHHLAYVDDTLPGDVLVAAERHRVECATCGAHDTLVRRSLLIARNLPSIEPSADFSARLEARLREVREAGPDAAAGNAAWDGGATWDPRWSEARWSDARWYARLVHDAGGWGRQAAAAAVVLAAVSAGYVLRGGRDGAAGTTPNAVAAPVADATAPASGANSLGATEVALRPATEGTQGAGRVGVRSLPRRTAQARRGAAARDTDDLLPAYIPLPAGALEASALLAPASVGIPVWPAALLAGEAPLQLRGVGAGGPSVRLVGLSH